MRLPGPDFVYDIKRPPSKFKVMVTGNRDCKSREVPAQFSCKEGIPLPISQRWNCNETKILSSFFLASAINNLFTHLIEL